MNMEREWTKESGKEGLSQEKVLENGAMAYIRKLTLKEKWQLNELLKALERKRLPSPSQQESTDKAV